MWDSQLTTQVNTELSKKGIKYNREVREAGKVQREDFTSKMIFEQTLGRSQGISYAST